LQLEDEKTSTQRNGVNRGICTSLIESDWKIEDLRALTVPRKSNIPLFTLFLCVEVFTG
jgi:hypothetical protein